MAHFREDNSEALEDCRDACDDALRILTAVRKYSARIRRDRPGDPFLVLDAVKCRAGVVGCRRSHNALAEMAAELGAAGMATLVLEDDACCRHAVRLRSLLRSLDRCSADADLINLGPAFMNGVCADENTTSRACDGVWTMRILHASLLHATIVLPHFAATYDIEMRRCSVVPADDAVGSFMARFHWRATWPTLFWQRPSLSDIANKHRDMNRCMRSSDLLLAHVAHRDFIIPSLLRIEDALPPRIVTFSQALRMDKDYSDVLFICDHPQETRSLPPVRIRASHAFVAARALRAPSVIVYWHSDEKEKERRAWIRQVDISAAVGKPPPLSDLGPEIGSVRIDMTNIPSFVRKCGLFIHSSMLHWDVIYSIRICAYRNA